MALFAGPVFTEWYWGPIFFAILYGPLLVAAACVADLVVRRRHGRLPLRRRLGLWAAVAGGGAVLILGARGVIDDVRHDREASAAARAFDFAPYAPSPLPAPFRERLATAHDGALVSSYDAGPGAYAFAYQQRPGAEVTLTAPGCSLRGLRATGTTFFDGPCRELRTPGGIAVFAGASRAIVRGGEAFALLDGTLVRLVHVRIAERDVLAYFDSLRPVDPGDLEFKRG